MRNRARACVTTLLACLTSGCNSLLDPDGAGVRGQTIVSGGLIRYYEWTAPDGNEAKPVLLAFHGLGGNATDMRSMSGLASAGREAGYAVVFPQASDEGGRGWAVGCPNCTDGDRLGIDDVAYVDAVLDDLATRTSIDRSRVYATGFSMGGWFTYTLACRRANSVRAIAPVGGLMPRPVAAECAASRPLGVLVIFGDRDATQPYAGSPGAFGLLGADSSATFWSTAAQCRFESGDERKVFGGTRVDVLTQDQCDGGVSIERHRVIDLAHTWPDGSYSATREVMRFFAGH